MQIELKLLVNAPDGADPAAIRRVVQRLLAAGQEDAGRAPPDWEDPDTALAAALEIQVEPLAEEG